jgi:hypothetical protein
MAATADADSRTERGFGKTLETNRIETTPESTNSEQELGKGTGNCWAKSQIP